MKLTKFGKFLVDIFDTEAVMTEREEKELSANLFMGGMTLKQLDNMSPKDVNNFVKNKK